MYYLIKESLTPCLAGEMENAAGETQYVAVLTTGEWQQRQRDCDQRREQGYPSRLDHCKFHTIPSDSFSIIQSI